MIDEYRFDMPQGYSVRVNTKSFDGDLKRFQEVHGGLYSTVALIENHITYESPTGNIYGQRILHTLAKYSSKSCLFEKKCNRFLFEDISDSSISHLVDRYGYNEGEPERMKVSEVNLAGISDYTDDRYKEIEGTDLIDVTTITNICELIDCYDDSVPHICFSPLGDSNGKD